MKKIIITVLCIMCLFFSINQNVKVKAAQENTNKPTNENALADILDSDPSVAGTPNDKRPSVPDTKYQKYFTFQTTRTLKGIFSSQSLYFYMPDYWDTQYVYAEIEYNVSRLITKDVPASLTFLINNVPVDSCKISYSESGSQLVYVQIPTKLLKKGYNILDVSSFVKLYSSKGCSEEQSGSNWVTIQKDSYVYAGYDLKDPEHKISYFPYPFISTVNPAGEGTAVLVSDKAVNGELAAAMYLYSDISSSTEEENKITIGKYQKASGQEADKKIIIMQTKNLPEDLLPYLKENPDNPDSITYDLSKRAMVCFTDDKNNNPMLLIVADKEQNLMEAVHMLLDKNRLYQEKESITFINEGKAEEAYKASQLSQLVTENYSVKDIEGRGMTFVGPFHQEQNIYLPFKNTYILSEAGKITFKFRYSENLDFNRSLITIYWGDVPIASKKLNKKNAGGDELIFMLPSDVVGTGASSIKISFDLEIQDLFCTMRQEEMPWAYITEDSVFYLPLRENTGLSFDYLPSPFQNKGTFSDVMLVVSDDPDSAELELLGQAVALYGKDAAPYGKLKVIRAKEFNKDDSDYNIITVGTSNNSFIKGLKDNLYFSLNDNGDAFSSNNKLVFSGQYAKSIAALELLKSPYAKQRALFAICGVNDETLNQASLFLETKSNSLLLTGDCILLDHDQEIKSFKFIKDSENSVKPTLQQYIVKNKNNLMFVIMCFSIMLIMLIGAVLMLLRARKYKSNEDEQL